jgi:hypothetical protein
MGTARCQGDIPCVHELPLNTLFLTSCVVKNTAGIPLVNICYLLARTALKEWLLICEMWSSVQCPLPRSAVAVQ